MVNSGKKWCIAFLTLTLAALLCVCSLTAIIDPYFHYHAPLPFLQYPIDNERYQNDGIVKHFSYDAIIAGTSMMENFKTSECDALFGVNAVKTCFNGSSLKETTDHLRRAIAANPDLRMVIRGYDGWNLLEPADTLKEADKIPFFLYDSDPFNDVKYLLNKTVFLDDTMGVLKHTLKGNATTTFDDYASWHNSVTYSKENVLENYDRPPTSDSQIPWTEETAALLTENLRCNAIALAQENPQIQFYYFFTPYSVLYMDEQKQWGLMDRQFAAFRQACQELLELDNVRLFSFFDDYDMITNLDNYYDSAHYHSDYNTKILQFMAAGEHELTKDNYLDHWQEVEAFYRAFDYESLFQ